MDSFSPKKRSWIMAQVKSNGNKSTEQTMIKLLKKNKIHGWRRAYSLMGKPDFTFPDKMVAIFVDGCFWHGHPLKCRIPRSNRKYWLEKISRNVSRDKHVNKSLRKIGWRVLRIWEDELKKPSTITKLRKALNYDDK